MTTNNNKVSFTWKTEKNEDGTFSGIVLKNLYLDKPVNGRYVMTSHQANYKRSTRARAKSAAIQGMKFYTQEFNRRIAKNK